MDTTEELIRQQLADDETRMETIRPEHVGVFDRYDFVLVPVTVAIGLLFIGLAIAPFYGGFDKGMGYLSLIGLMFLIIAFYLIFGRLWYRVKRKSRDIYVITDKRVLLINTLREDQMESLDKKQIQPVVKRDKIYLKAAHISGDLYYGLGLDLFFRFQIAKTPIMYGMKDPERVMNLLK